MVTKSCQKLPPKFYCKKCDYGCRNKYNFKKHLSTTKHKMVTHGNTNGNTMLKHVCKNCNKAYKFRSGLSRHMSSGCKMGQQKVLKKKLPKVAKHEIDKNVQENIAPSDLKSLIQTMSQQSSMIEKLIDNQKNMIPKLGNNNNNKISINVFLNKHCQNAMNLTDFVDNIKISLEDLYYTNRHGYVKGISNIFTKNLTDLKATERPIHCSDQKRLQFYVKDQDIWDKEHSNEKLDSSIHRITKKQILQIKAWEGEHPNFLDDESLTGQWQNMIHSMMGSVKPVNAQRDKEAIKKNISMGLGVKDAIEKSN